MTFPRLIPKNQEGPVFEALRERKRTFYRNGGKRCRCGGLIYPGERYTCTHSPDGRTLSRDEIDEIWEREMKDSDAMEGGGDGE